LSVFKSMWTKMFVATVQFVEWFCKAACNKAGPTKQARSRFDSIAMRQQLTCNVTYERSGGSQSGQSRGSE